MTRFLFTVAAGMLMTGCFAVAIPEVKDPAPETELRKVLQAADRAVNPRGKSFNTFRTKGIGRIAKMSVMIQTETFGRVDRKQLLERMTAPGMPVTLELFDGKEGFHIIQGVQTKKLSGKKLAQIRFGAGHPDGRKFTDGYENIKLDKNIVTVNGVPCYRLIGSPKGEPELPPREFFLGVKDFLPVRICSVVHADMGDVQSVIDIRRYRDFDGLKLPELMKVTQLNIEVDIKLMEFVTDCDIPDRMFDREALEDEE